MLLTQSQFQEKVEDDMLHIALIGMSNVGKSFRSDQMSQVLGFESTHVDESIEAELNLPGMNAMAEWMGYPYEEKYTVRSKEYLALEKKHTISPNLKALGNFVLDTTGSVIYHDNEVKSFLKNNFLVVLLDIPSERLDMMKQQFFEEPKSVFWGDSFSQKKDENNNDALLRCYPQLLEDRMEMYRDWADIIIPGEISKMEGLSIERFMEVISFALPPSQHA